MGVEGVGLEEVGVEEVSLEDVGVEKVDVEEGNIEEAVGSGSKPKELCATLQQCDSSQHLGGQLHPLAPFILQDREQLVGL